MFIDLIELSGLIFIVYFSISNVMNGNMTEADAMTLVMLVFKLVQPLLIMLDYIDGITDGLSLYNDYEKIINYIKEDNSYINKSEFNDSISLNNVTFSYDENSKNVLENININIHKGQKVGICGTSGGVKLLYLNY